MSIFRNTLNQRIARRRLIGNRAIRGLTYPLRHIRAKLQPVGKYTPFQFRRSLAVNGITLKQFCDEHGIDPTTATALLLGRLKGYYGEAHRAAVAMGLKPDPKEAA